MLRRAADGGDGEAAFAWAWVQAIGEGVDRNLMEAEKWARIAAEKGSPDGAVLAGRLVLRKMDLLGALECFRLGSLSLGVARAWAVSLRGLLGLPSGRVSGKLVGDPERDAYGYIGVRMYSTYTAYGELAGFMEKMRGAIYPAGMSGAVSTCRAWADRLNLPHLMVWACQPGRFASCCPADVIKYLSRAVAAGFGGLRDELHRAAGEAPTALDDVAEQAPEHRD
jgi:hypothetical protein